MSTEPLGASEHLEWVSTLAQSAPVLIETFALLALSQLRNSQDCVQVAYLVHMFAVCQTQPSRSKVGGKGPAFDLLGCV